MNIESIGVYKYPLSKVLSSEEKEVYEIPKYQRGYIWGKYEWEKLYDDLMENDPGYFLGSIICINTSGEAIGSPKFEVVDGQQRLTTISIFLAAMYSALKKRESSFDDEQQNDLFQLKRKLVVKGTNDKVRVIPQEQDKNNGDYFGLLAREKIIQHKKMPEYAGNRRILKAFDYFTKRLEEQVANSNNQVAELFKILETVNSAIIVMIVVPSHSDACILFESLNNRGVPLTAIDLIKNLLLAQLEKQCGLDIDSCFERWNDVLVSLGDYSSQERFFRQYYNAFREDINKDFRTVGQDKQYPLGTIATRSTLLGIYEKLVLKDPDGFLNDITGGAELYSGIILNNADALSAELADAYQDLQRVQGAPSYLLLLYLSKKQSLLSIDDAEMVKIAKLLTSFFIRRNVTDVPPTRDLTRLFMAYIDDIEANGYSGNAIYDNLRNKLLSVSSSDTVFEEKLRGNVYAENSWAVRFILCDIAKQSMTVENKKDLWEMNKTQYVWTIEHIFPQGENIPDCWVKMIADGDRALAQEYQNKYVHTFGNLTLTGFNSQLSNKPFEEKKNMKNKAGVPTGYLNGLNLNEDVCDKDKWTVTEITARTDKLVNKILAMYKM